MPLDDCGAKPLLNEYLHERYVDPGNGDQPEYLRA